MSKSKSAKLTESIVRAGATPESFSRDYDSFVPDTTSDLVKAKLNVLARQKRVEEYLALCQKEERHLRYALKLCELGRVAEGVKYAMQHLEEASQTLALAQTLRDLKYIDDALTLGERGLGLSGNKFELASWLARWNRRKDATRRRWRRGLLRLRNNLPSSCIRASNN